jgi:hypothetical protein
VRLTFEQIESAKRELLWALPAGPKTTGELQRTFKGIRYINKPQIRKYLRQTEEVTEWIEGRGNSRTTLWKLQEGGGHEYPPIQLGEGNHGKERRGFNKNKNMNGRSHDVGRGLKIISRYAEDSLEEMRHIRRMVRAVLEQLQLNDGGGVSEKRIKGVIAG